MYHNLGPAGEVPDIFWSGQDSVKLLQHNLLVWLEKGEFIMAAGTPIPLYRGQQHRSGAPGTFKWNGFTCHIKAPGHGMGRKDGWMEKKRECPALR